MASARVRCQRYGMLNFEIVGLIFRSHGLVLFCGFLPSHHTAALAYQVIQLKAVRDSASNSQTWWLSDMAKASLSLAPPPPKPVPANSGKTMQNVKYRRVAVLV